MLRRWILLACALFLNIVLFGESIAQDVEESDVPEIPSLDEVQAGRAVIEQFTPLDFNFRIGVIGEFEIDVETASGNGKQIKTPLILINPGNADIGVYAKNFPAKIIARSPNGRWVVGVAPSYAVEGSSGSRDRECAVSLRLPEGDITLIKEFSRHSTFQAIFDPSDANAIYYCVNQPAAVNKIIRHNLKSDESEVLSAEGNRFYIYGLKLDGEPAIWVADPLSVVDYPVLSLIELKTVEVVETVEFPGTSEVIASPDGSRLLVIVSDQAEASIGWFNTIDQTYHQVPGLVLTRPTFKWANNGHVVLAKESTTTHDRFLWLDLDTGEVREIFSGYFKVGQWDISPDDDALVFVTDSPEDPVLFVVPLDPDIGVVNRIKLTDVDNVTWLGNLVPRAAGGGSWLENSYHSSFVLAD